MCCVLSVYGQLWFSTTLFFSFFFFYHPFHSPFAIYWNCVDLYLCKRSNWNCFPHPFVFRFSRIQEPLLQRRAQLEKVKRIHQFQRDIEDEKMWIEEKMPLATSNNYGNSLLSVQLLMKKTHVSHSSCLSAETSSDF